MTKWEYRDAFVHNLPRYGREGWEAYATCGTHRGIFYLKRPIEEPEPTLTEAYATIAEKGRMTADEIREWGNHPEANQDG